MEPDADTIRMVVEAERHRVVEIARILEEEGMLTARALRAAANTFIERGEITMNVSHTRDATNVEISQVFSMAMRAAEQEQKANECL